MPASALLYREGPPVQSRALGLLVVEDETNVRQGFVEWLREQGFLVRAAVSGKRAIELARAPEIHIVLLDIMMPGPYDGLQAARIIRERYPDKAIIFVTAFNNEDTHLRAERLGIRNAEWVDKPSDESELRYLLEVIERVARGLEARQRARGYMEGAKAEGVAPAQALRLLRPLRSELPREVVEQLENEAFSPEARSSLVRELRDQLGQLRAALAQSGGDFQEHQRAFGPFKEAVLQRLWDLYEHTDEHHRRIASDLELAVRKLSSLDLNEQHVDALDFVLGRLAQPELDKEDVRDCKRILRYRGVETLIDLGKHRRPLLDLYLSEEEEDGGEEIP